MTSGRTSWIDPEGPEKGLIIVRHGKAEHFSPSGLDRDRPLRDKGHEQARWLGESITAMGIGGISTIVSSAAVRARETAEGIDAVLGVGLSFDDRLLVDEPASDAVTLINEMLSSTSLLIVVGHNPQVSRLAMVACGAIVTSGVSLRTGEAACLRLANDGSFGSGVLEHVIRMPKRDG